MNIIGFRHQNMDGALVMRGKEVTDLYLPNGSGVLVTGKVSRVLAGGKSGFVQFNNGEGFVSNLQGAKTGDVLLLNIKSPRRGNKAAELTLDIRVVGRCLVFLPHGKGVQFSKRLNKAQQEKLKQPLTALAKAHKGGWIVRHTAADVDNDLIAREAAYLSEQVALLPENGKRKSGEALPAPTPLQQAIIDHGLHIEKISLADKTALPWLQKFAPDLVPLVKDVSPPDLDELFDELMTARVELKNGAWLQIDRTEALTAIDVNGGDQTNHLQTNLTAVDAVARHIRLRNLGGMILIDLIRMTDKNHRDQVLDRLRQKTAADPSTVDVLGFSRLGLVEMTRHARGLTTTEIIEAQHGRL